MNVELNAYYDYALPGESPTYVGAYNAMVASSWTDTVTPRPYSLMGSGTYKTIQWGRNLGRHLLIIGGPRTSHFLGSAVGGHLYRGDFPQIVSVNYVCTAQMNKFFVGPYSGKYIDYLLVYLSYSSTNFPGVKTTLDARINVYHSDGEFPPQNWALTRPDNPIATGQTVTITLNQPVWCSVLSAYTPLKKWIYVTHSVLNYEDVPNPASDGGIYPTDINYAFSMANSMRMITY